MASTQLAQALEVYTKGTKAWFIDEKEGWVSATLVSKHVDDHNVTLTFVNDDNQDQQHVFESTLAALEKCNGEILPPLRNPPKMEDADDLTSLSYLNEPSVLHTIRLRYQQRNIYTYSGIVLIASNPFDRVSLYEPTIIQKYSGRRRGELEPHLFAIAEDAYRCMIREKSNQTIIVSGESGAGKTVSAKYIMRYFATADDKETVGKKSREAEGMTEVEEQILATNPIMEAFGNAKTTRNDNSSRFGKYIEIQFDKQCNIIGARIRTYLLERSRLIYQPETERNYHIFYQLCAGASDAQRQRMSLKPWSEFQYLNQSGTGVIPGVDDAEEFTITRASLSKIGITDEIQEQIFTLLAALLHLGDIGIGGRSDAMVSDDDPALLMATQLLGIKTSEFKKWIIRKQISTRSEKIMTNLTPLQAQVVRDSMAKFIYANLFDWLVAVVNESLACRDELNHVANFIGVLDIYGFEHFKKNSFEQFCINYANEKLQQQFNQHVFKLEQEEYVREAIDWTFINFSDNQKCIELIEGKLGILSLLDEESRLPSGSDQGFCNKLYSNFGTQSYQDHFKKPRFSNNAFTIVHYAHDVQYEAEGFMDKNKDTVPDEHLTLLHSSEFKFLVEMLQGGNRSPSPNPTPSSSEIAQKKLSIAKKPTLGSMFKVSLINLMDTIAQTNVHYIRCIKPNEAKAAWTFEPQMVLAQLRACGVLETIRISCAGYPSRWTFAEFVERYYVLVDAEYWYPKNDKVKETCTAIVAAHIKDADKYQIGLTKIFFRAGQLAYLEKLRTDRWTQIAVFLQKNARRFIARRRYLCVRKMVIGLQAVTRRIVAKNQLEHLRREKAATIIQTQWRRYVARQWYLKQRAIIIQIQAASRGLIARVQFNLLRKNNAATQIQRIVRGWLVRKRYQAQRMHIIRIQSCIRRRNARKQLIVMRAEARSVSHFKEVSYKLETKVVELTQTLKQQKEEKAELKMKAKELESQVRSWIERYDQLDEQAKDLEKSLNAAPVSGNTFSALQQQRMVLHNEYTTSLNNIKKQDREIARLTEELMRQKQQVAHLKRVSQEAVQTVQEEPNMAELKKQIAALKSQLTHTLGRPSRPSQKTTPVARDRRRRRVSVLQLHDNCTDQELLALLKDEALLQEDILDGLIHSHEIPSPNTQQPLSLTDITDPARTLGFCITQLWQRGCLIEADKWLLAIMEAMERRCMNSVGEDAIIPSLYWLLNAHQLYVIICAAEISLEKDTLRDNKSSEDLVKCIDTAKEELQIVQENIYSYMMTELKKQLHRVTIPAVIESQGLPGFVTSPNTLSSGLSAQGDSTSMDDLLKLLTKVDSAMVGFSVDTLIKEQAFDELLKYIGTVAFNDLISRRNFNSWKRAIQIQHNTSRLEEWCKAHSLADATVQLEHVIEAAKLLQLKKTTAEDIQTIIDICWVLSPGQIQKLIQSYCPAEYESPISHDVLRAAAPRNSDKSNTSLLLESVPIDKSVYEIPVAHVDDLSSVQSPPTGRSDRLQALVARLS